MHGQLQGLCCHSCCRIVSQEECTRILQRQRQCSKFACMQLEGPLNLFKHTRGCGLCVWNLREPMVKRQ